jgi:hypothetical protein
MSNRSRKAIATLMRWRAFEEDLASAKVSRCQADSHQAAEQVRNAKHRVEGVRQRLAELVEAPNIDLGRLQAVARIEEVALRQQDVAASAHVAVQQQEERARVEHLLKRAATRVVDTRMRRVEAACHERGEKAMFDSMADLHRPTARRKP